MKERPAQSLPSCPGNSFSVFPAITCVAALMDVETMTPETLAELKELIAVREEEAQDEQ